MKHSIANLIVVCSGLAAWPAWGAETLPGVEQRFAQSIEEVPSFQRHVVPLLSCLGCNGRACHGSFQGQGGFRLSLFGYDFQADHESLLGGEQPRIDRRSPAKSLMLQKPTLQVDHGGDRRFAADSWQHRLLLRWIESGALPASETDAHFVALEVEPREMIFDAVGQSRPLKAVVRWSDGTREDVTALCRFRSNDESVAAIDDFGRVKAIGRGDTDVVLFYDNGVVTVPVLLPVSDRHGPNYPTAPTPTQVDELVVAKLRKLGIVPAELCNDAEFLRRVSLDMTGTLPHPDEVLAFIADPAADKRNTKIDELLQRPTYAAWWSVRLGDITGNNEQNGPVGGEQALRRQQAEQWYHWLYRRLRDNMPYDQLVAGIVLAQSRKPDQSFDDYCQEMSAYFRRENPADFAQRDTMPYYWTRRALGQSKGKALSFSYSFLGVRLECAECHKHPYDQWTKQDFDQFTAFFERVKHGDVNRTQHQAMKRELGLTGDEDSGQFKREFLELAQAGKVVPFRELRVSPPPRESKGAKSNVKARAGRVITPKLLGGEEVVDRDYDDPRQALMDWMRQDDNPYFARAIVNRVWANYFNVGIIDPPDDMNLANPPSNEPLLDYLVAEFVAHGYDVHWLHREITRSHAYQRSWRSNDTNRADERNFSRAVVRRVPAEVAYDAVVLATAADATRRAKVDDESAVKSRAIGTSSGLSGGRDSGDYGVRLFGKPPRALNCDCERSSEPSLLQTVFLLNDDEVLKMLDRSDGWLREATRPTEMPVSSNAAKKSKKRSAADSTSKPASSPPSADAPELVRQAYLRTVSRLPSESESQIALEHLRGATDLTAGLRDLLWALLNTKEFILNH